MEGRRQLRVAPSVDHLRRCDAPGPVINESKALLGRLQKAAQGKSEALREPLQSNRILGETSFRRPPRLARCCCCRRRGVDAHLSACQPVSLSISLGTRRKAAGLETGQAARPREAHGGKEARRQALCRVQSPDSTAQRNAVSLSIECDPARPVSSVSVRGRKITEKTHGSSMQARLTSRPSLGPRLVAWESSGTVGWAGL